ncbi:transposable element Tcb2 transposase [Trichonephila clavipes]|nr:transposable element Tcb2 transposase [Trichonephila clavipes]
MLIGLQRAEVDMPLRRFRRQYEQLLQFERERIIGMMEAGWSARRVARQLGRSNCAVRRCWDQWIREMSFTRRPDSGHPRQTRHREDHHIVRNAHVQPTASSASIQAHVARSLGAPVFCRTIRRRLADGHLESRFLLRMLPLTPTHRRLCLESTAGVMISNDIAYNTRWPLVLICGIMTAQRYVRDILQPHVLPLMQRLP